MLPPRVAVEIVLRVRLLLAFQVDSLRKGLSSDKRPVLDLLAVEGWRALLGLLDGEVSSGDVG